MSRRSKDQSPSRWEAIPGQADRLKRLRAALGFKTATAFAAFLDIGNQRYNGFENHYPLSREVAFLIVRKVPGLSLDWLYFGRIDGLSVGLARSLGELPAETGVDRDPP